MNAPAGLVEFVLNGAATSALPGETLIQVADRLGVEIPRLCYEPGMRPDGNCRSCMVEIKGERVLAPSCCRAPAPGMDVRTDNSARASLAQKLIVELLAADVPARVYKPDSELAQWQRKLGVGKPRFAPRAQPAADLSHPAMAVTSTRASSARAACAPAARSRSTTSSATRFAARTRRSCSTSTTRWAHSTCVACGECVQACPTGALAPAHDAYLVVARPDRAVGLPVLRRRLPDHLSRQGRSDCPRRGPRRPGQS